MSCGLTDTDGIQENLLTHDVAIVGAGAAGLATAIFARRQNSSRSVALIEGARKPGAKILVSGGSRCNLTNTIVSDRDFWGGRSSIVRRVLRAFPVQDTIDFFREIGVPVHEEAGGKLFPDSNRARDVLDALLREAERVGATLIAGCRVNNIAADANGFQLDTTRGPIVASQVVLATGGQSLPKSGSDGAGYGMARGLGHTIVPTTPGLTPLILEEPGTGVPLHRTLAGVSQPAELTIWIDGAAATRLAGSLLWTHVGVSGPVAMNASRHWLRAKLEGRDAAITLSFLPGESFEDVDRRWMMLAAERPLLTLQNALAALGTATPASTAAAIVGKLGLDGSRQLAHLPREDRRRLVHALVAWPLPVTGARGYNYAEVTAGGVSLSEIDPSTMESRVQRGLFLVGEILDVDGRIGGFNFQWAWASGRAAGIGLGQRKSD